MKVYLLRYQEGDYQFIHGIYSNLEKANKQRITLRTNNQMVDSGYADYFVDGYEVI